MDYRYLSWWKLKANVKFLPTKEYLLNVIRSCLDIVSYYESVWYDDEFINELNKSEDEHRIEERKTVIEDVLS